VSESHINAPDLEAIGWSLAEVRRLCPWATEYTALDGWPCWRAQDLTELRDEYREEGRL
jgi:hypothetical protein